MLDNQKNPEEKEREDSPTSNYQAGNEKHLFTSKNMPFDQQELEFRLKEETIRSGRTTSGLEVGEDKRRQRATQTRKPVKLFLFSLFVRKIKTRNR